MITAILRGTPIKLETSEAGNWGELAKRLEIDPAQYGIMISRDEQPIEVDKTNMTAEFKDGDTVWLTMVGEEPAPTLVAFLGQTEKTDGVDRTTGQRRVPEPGEVLGGVHGTTVPGGSARRGDAGNPGGDDEPRERILA